VVARGQWKPASRAKDNATTGILARISRSRMLSTSVAPPIQCSTAKAVTTWRCRRTRRAPAQPKSAATIVVSAAAKSRAKPAPRAPDGNHVVTIIGTARCGSSRATPDTRRYAAANAKPPYRTNTRTAAHATARNAVRSSRAAKIFWPYHGAAM